MRSIFKPWVAYFCKILEKKASITLEHQKMRNELRKFSLKTLEFKKKKIGSNVRILRKLEPQQKLEFL